MISCNGTVAGGRLSRVNILRKGRQEPNRQEEYVGDKGENKEGDCLRIVTQNINGIGQKSNNIKEKSVKEFIQQFHIDLYAIQQLDVCWDKVRNRNKIWDRWRGWAENSNLSVAYSTDEVDRRPYQPGGAAVISSGRITHTWDSSGTDNRKLGRWAWTRFQGSYGRNFRVVSIYRPFQNTKNANAAFMTQLRYSVKNRGGEVSKRVVFGRFTARYLGLESYGG